MTYCYYRLPREVDFDTSGKVRSDLLALVNEERGDVIIDCVHLDFIDPVGVAVIGQIRRLLRVYDRTLRLVNLDPRTRRPFELVGLTDYLDVTESEPV